MGLVFNAATWHISWMEMTLRMMLAIGLGGLIGLERELGGHSAGFRTHILVCLGSAIIALLSMYGFAEFASEPNVRLDPSRLAAQVISGIGFLGAGTIMRTGLGVSGLTTAASLWVSAAIGLAAGAGFYFGSVLASLLVVISLFALNKLEKLFSRSKKVRELLITMDKSSPGLNEVLMHLNRSGLQINKLIIEKEDEGYAHTAKCCLTIRIQLKLKKIRRYEDAIAAVAYMDGVMGMETAALSA